MASFFNNNAGGLDDRLTWRKSDPGDADAVFSFLRQPPPSVATNHTPHRETSSSGMLSNGNGNGANGDARGHAHRRFTSSFASPFGYSRHAFEEPPVPDIPAPFKQALSPGEKKKAEYEYLMKKKLDRQRQLDQLSRDREQDELDLKRLQQELGFASMKNNGPQSEPTTPPEYNDGNGFPGAISRPNRFSTSNMMSATGIFGNRKLADSSALASPPNERARAYNALTGGSGPQSKHTSDEEDGYDDGMGFNPRSAAITNRHSMPVTRRDPPSRNGLTDSPSLLGHVNTHAFLFGDEDKTDKVGNGDMSEATSSASQKSRPVSYVHSNDEAGFPVLLRQQTSELESSEPSSAQASKRSSFRHSLPAQKEDDSPPFSYSATSKMTSGQVTPTKSASNRHSFGTPFNGTYAATNKRTGLIGSPPSAEKNPAVAPKLQSSYSTNDIPTVKTSTGPSYNGNSATAEQRLHQHNASLGRIPAAAVAGKRHSREMSGGGDSTHHDENNIYSVLQSPPKGSNSTPSSSQGSVNQTSAGAINTPPAVSGMQQTKETTTAFATSTPFTPGMYQQYNQHAPPSNFSMQPGATQGQTRDAMAMLTSSMNAMTLPMQQPGVQANITAAPPSQGFSAHMYNQSFNQGYASTPFPSYGGGRYQDPSPRGVPPQRRAHAQSDLSDSSRFANIPLESLQGEIYTLCKDQHGCRFLQKKLEEHNEGHIELIFKETKGHMVELMTDPFGNYLCQKLLEHTNDDQRTGLINNAAPHMVKIALNQHGTRALQKMIEYVATREQVDTLIDALKDHVVQMIQDLNGNHVIQKCLNRLRAEDVQFIISAVASNCVVVGTHRHGCCVIQRCIDHATGPQKAQLIGSITNCSFPLVQDPFGNYVLQYIFDQHEDNFSQMLCQTFLGHVANLSKQKFSSNVMEKCIRVADAKIRHEMINELITSPEFDRLADDAFANYVIQTAWMQANAEDEVRIAERMRPVLPRLRHKPHGRRFQIRLQETEKRHPNMTAGQNLDMSAPEQTPSMHRPSTSQESYYQPPDSGYGNGYSGFSGASTPYSQSDYSRPSTHRSSNPPMPNMAGFPSQGFGGYSGMAHGQQNPWGNSLYGQPPHY